MGVWEYGSMGMKTVNGQRNKKPLGVAENPFPELPFFTT
jgi:hypothetical protein